MIVGAGFSGTVLTANLLRRPPPGLVRLVLIERTTSIGRGVAYARREHPYLLNVPASRMSASSAEPLQFLKYIQRSEPRATADDFLPRASFGDYLEEFLAAAELAAPRGVRLEKMQGEVTAIGRPERSLPLQVVLGDGRRLVADDVVLASGNPPPAILPVTAALSGSTLFASDPWSRPLDIRPADSVLIIGTGLTMVDVVLAATAHGKPWPTIHAISRHGLVPPAQTSFRDDAFKGDGNMLLLAASASLQRLLRSARVLAREAQRMGGDWREAVTFVRHMAPTLWQRLPEHERRRFLRHVRAYWDVHRHRLPPETIAPLDELRRAGALHIHAGRLSQLTPAGQSVAVTWTPRGQTRARQLKVNRVVNCTGPDYDLRRSHEPLLQSLVASGLAVPDPLGLGLKTGAHGALMDADGWPGLHLYYLGPMLRADHWEATAALELRGHAERLASHLSQ